MLERKQPGVGLGFEARRRAPPADQVPDLVEGDEVGDLAANRRDRDLQPPAAPADRPPAGRGAGELDVVFATEVLDVGLHQLDASALARVSVLPEHGRQGSQPRGSLHTWDMAEATHLRLALAQIDPTV